MHTVSTRVIVTVGAALLVMVAGCSSNPGITRAEANGAGTQVHLELAACNGDHAVVWSEGAEEIHISVTDQRRRRPFSGRDDCADIIGPLDFDEPIGDRVLIDDSSGTVIPVRFDPWNQAEYTRADFLAAVRAAARCVEDASPEAVVSVVTRADGTPDVDVEWPDLADGERSDADSFPECLERHVEPLRR